jgi:hypothetical protein
MLDGEVKKRRGWKIRSQGKGWNWNSRVESEGETAATGVINALTDEPPAAPVCRSSGYRDALWHWPGSVSKLSMCWVVFNHSNNKTDQWPPLPLYTTPDFNLTFLFSYRKKIKIIFSVMVFLIGDSNQNHSPEMLLVKLDWVTESVIEFENM